MVNTRVEWYGEGRFIVRLSSDLIPKQAASCWRDRRRNGREHAEGGCGDRLLVLLAVLARVRGAEFDLAVHAGER